MKVLITHEGQQSVFRRIAALNNNGIAVSYATSFYAKSTPFYKIFERLLTDREKARLRGRRCESINDEDVYVFHKYLGIIFILVNRLDRSRRIRDKVLRLLSKSFAKSVLRLLEKKKYDMVIVLGESADLIADQIFQKGIFIPVVKDTTSANWEYCNQIYQNDVMASGIFGQDMKNIFLDCGGSNRKKLFQVSRHYFRVIVSSQFVADSYQEQMDREKICIVTYGMDVKNFTEKSEYRVIMDKLKVVYVGNVDERKGIYYINELAKKCKDIASFSVIGDTTLSKRAFADLRENVLIRGRISHQKLPEEYKKYDVFLFPSLSDSFGNVVAEAMAAGLPVICSSNAGVSDLIQDKVDGYVVEYNDTAKMEEILRDLYANPKKISEIGTRARNTAVENSLENYEKIYAGTVKDIMRSWNGTKAVKK